MTDKSAKDWAGLPDLLCRRREDIIAEWVRLSDDIPDLEPKPHYKEHRSLNRALSAIAEALDTHSYESLETYLTNSSRWLLIEEVSTVREVPADIDVILQGTALWKEAIMSVLWETLPADSPNFREAVTQLDRCFRQTVGHYGHLYSDTMNRHLFRETSQRLNESESLQRVTAALLERLKLNEILDIVCAEARRLTGGRHTVVYLVEDSEWLCVAGTSDDSWLKDDYGERYKRRSIKGTVTGEVMRGGKPAIVNNADLPPKYQSEDDSALILIAPLSAKGAVIGTINVVDKAGGFTADDVRIIGLFADQAAIAIENTWLRHQEEQLAVIQERQRLARDLHDSVTQSLYSITLYAEAALRLLNEEPCEAAMSHLIDLRDTTQEAMREMRLLIFELRPPLLQKEGLAAAIQARLDIVETRSGLETKLYATGEARFPQDIEEELYRIAQEALNNVLKHARAKKVEVHLSSDESGISMAVSDNGVGFTYQSTKKKGCLGLSGMRERVERINGELEIESAPGQGTVVRVHIAPLATYDVRRVMENT